VELQFRVADPSHRTAARNEVIDLIYERCKESGFLLAMPAQSYFCPLPSVLQGADSVADKGVRSAGAI
jgi:hypothetical protein